MGLEISLNCGDAVFAVIDAKDVAVFGLDAMDFCNATRCLSGQICCTSSTNGIASRINVQYACLVAIVGVLNTLERGLSNEDACVVISAISSSSTCVSDSLLLSQSRLPQSCDSTA